MSAERNTDSFISTRTAALDFGVTTRTIERYIEAKLIEGVKRFGRYYKIPIKGWNKFKARNLKDVA